MSPKLRVIMEFNHDSYIEALSLELKIARTTKMRERLAIQMGDELVKIKEMCEKSGSLWTNELERLAIKLNVSTRTLWRYMQKYHVNCNKKS